MSSLLYFGAPSKKVESVSSEVSALNLQMVRAAPSDIILDIAPHYIQPGHAVYTKFLASHSYVSDNSGRSISTRVPPYHPLANKILPPFAKAPTVIFSYGVKLSPEKIEDIKIQTGADETWSQGKLAFIKVFDASTFQKVLDTNPIRTTPNGTDNINISALQIYLFLHRLFHEFNLLNQYPAFHTNNKADVSSWFMGLMDECDKTQNVEDVETGMDIKVRSTTLKDPNYMIHTNLVTPKTSYRYMIVTDNDIPTSDNGLVMPYVTHLTKTDNQTVPRVIQNFFMGYLGVNAGQALQMFESVKMGYGVIAKTGWGDELSHMYKCIDIALRTQCYLRVLQGPNVSYGGCVLFGGMYTIRHGDREFQSVDRPTLVQALKKASPHHAALIDILVLAGKTTAEATVVASTIFKMTELSFTIRSLALTEVAKLEITKKAQLLNFSNSDYLTPTSYNVSRVFNAINNSAVSDHSFPLHPDAILYTERAYRLLGAFGVTAPSFRVVGGKKMSLEGLFQVPEIKDGERTLRNVSKIGYYMVPLKVAIEDFRTMKEEKSILNPFGNPIGNRVSTNSVVRSVEKEAMMSVLSSIRNAVGASAEVSQASKRKAQQEEEGSEAIKKARTDLFSFT